MPTQTKPFGDFASVELLEAPSEFTWKDIAENKFEPEVQIFRCSNFKDSKVYTWIQTEFVHGEDNCEIK